MRWLPPPAASTGEHDSVRAIDGLAVASRRERQKERGKDRKPAGRVMSASELDAESEVDGHDQAAAVVVANVVCSTALDRYAQYASMLSLPLRSLALPLALTVTGHTWRGEPAKMPVLVAGNNTGHAAARNQACSLIRTRVRPHKPNSVRTPSPSPFAGAV